MVTRRKPKATQNNQMVNDVEEVESTVSETAGENSTGEKSTSPAPAPQKQKPETKKEPETKVHLGRRVWPD